MIKINLTRSEYLKIGFLLLIFVGGTTGSYFMLKPKKTLPFYNPSDLNTAVVADDLEGKGRGHRIGNFHLLDQHGNNIDSTALEGKVYVADFFFTTCPSICVPMGEHFQVLQEQFSNHPDFALVSHTVMPEVDSVPVLKKYADKLGAISGVWHLLTGEKEEIYRLARRQYFAVMEPGTSFDEHDFIHTENFILVDRHKRIRGFYDGTDPIQIEVLKKDLEYLLSRDD